MYYLMAAAVIAETRVEDVSATLRTLPRGKAQTIHWRDEQADVKEYIAKTIATTEVESLLVFGAMVDPRKQERARAQILRHLLWELDQRQVSHATLESRHAERDQHDITTIGRLRNAGWLSRRLTVSHAKATQHPILWVADAVAGAAGDQHCGDGDTFACLADLVTPFDLGHLD